MNQNTYYVYKIGKRSINLFSDRGINDNPNVPYDSVTLWRFYDQNIEIHFLQIGNFAFCCFGKSDELLSYLKSKGVFIKEFRILRSEYDYRFFLNDDYKLVISDRGGWGASFNIEHKNKRVHIFDYIQKETPPNFYKLPVELVASGKMRADGAVPVTIAHYLKQIKKTNPEQKAIGCGLSIFIYTMTLIFIISVILWLGMLTGII